MKRYENVALALLVLGAVCLANPLYVGPLVDATTGPSQGSRIYAAERVDLDTAAGQEQLVGHYGTRVAFHADRLTRDYLAADYRAPNETYRVLTAAFENGSARVPNDAVERDLRQLAEEYPYVSNESGRGVFRYRLVTRDGETLLNVTAVDDSQVADAVLDRYLIRYDALNESQRATVDRIIAETDADGYGGYRPYTNESMRERLPAVVLKEGTYYDVQVLGHVDDFGPGFFYFLVLSGAGLVLLLAALLTFVGGRVYERTGD